MAFRIGQYVLRGELNNTQRNSVNGWLEFAEDEGLKLELTGNLDGELAGKHLRFQAGRTEPISDEQTREQLDAIEFLQIGAVGSVVLRMVKVPHGSVEEFYRRSKLGERPPTEEKPCLYLEWFSQNGRLVVEIVDPEIDCGESGDEARSELTPEPLPDPEVGGGPGIVGFVADEQGHVEEVSFSAGDEPQEDDDPYQLFSPDLQQQLDASNREADAASAVEDPPSGRRSWDEVIPGIDEETKRMYEQWDEVVHGEKDEPLASLFDPPLVLKRPDQIADEAEAREALKVLLARLALHGVTLDMCEHYTALDAYRLLLEEILPEAQIHPQLPSTGFVQHYATWEYCPACEAEFDDED